MARLSLLAFIFLSAIPFGSNRPFFWAFWAAAIAVLALVFSSLQLIGSPTLRQKPAWLIIATVLYSAYAIALAAQILPLDTQFQMEFASSGPLRFTSQSLSIAPGETWFALLRWATYGLLFGLIFQVSNRSSASQTLMLGLAIIVGIQAIYALAALLQFGDKVLIFDKESYVGVATGTFVNRNSLATYLSLGAIICAVILTQDRKAQRRNSIGQSGQIIALLCLVFIVAALFSTNSRMGIFAGSAGIAAALLMRARSLRHAILALFLLAVLGSLGLYFYGTGLIDRLFFLEGAFSGRMELYQNIIDMIENRPLLGFGGGTFAQAYTLFHRSSAQSSVTWDHAHSTYLALWSGMGLVFGSFPIILILSIVFGGIKRAKHEANFTAEAAVIVGATVTVALHSLVDFSLEIMAIAFLYTAILAIGCARACRTTGKKAGI